MARLVSPLESVVVGKAVDVELEVLGHGMEGAPVVAGPTIQILAQHTESGQTLTTWAMIDKASSHYRATVTFPEAGVWKWSAKDGGYVVASPLPNITVLATADTGVVGKGEAASVVTIAVRDGSFTLPTTPIRVGDTIEWTNVGSLAHVVMSSDAGFEDVPLLQPGDTYRTTASTAGEFVIFCTPHSGMVATIVIVG